MSHVVKQQFGHRNRAGGSPASASAAGRGFASAGSNYSMTALLDEESRQRTLMIGMAVGLCALLAWVYFGLFNEESIEGKIITSPQQCASFGSASAEECADLWTRALKIHADTAPAYARIELCEQTHGAGRCKLAERSTVAARQSRFIPNMSAFMVERAPSGEVSLSPLYRDPQDGPDQWRKVAVPAPKA